MKTSLLNLLVGFEKPDRGSIRAGLSSRATGPESPPRPAPGASRLPLFWVPQSDGLWPHVTLEGHLEQVAPSAAGPLLSPEGKLLKDSHVDRVLNGKEGTAMQAFKNTLNDVELAAVITYERNALGNSKGDLIQPAQIKALR